MKEGRISEPIWKRSVLNQLKNRREEVLPASGTGKAGNLLDFGAKKLALASEAGFLGFKEEVRRLSGKILLKRAVNACAAMGAEPAAVQVQLLCPADFTEAELRGLMQALEEEAKEQSVSLLPGRIEASAAVSEPYLTLNGAGKSRSGEFGGLRAGQELLVSKWIAMEGTVLLAYEHEKELLARFTPVFVNRAKEMISYLSAVKEAEAAVSRGVCAILPIEEGGIFGALWELAEGAGLGLEVQAKEIPVRQETIEICELFHKNPYLLPSAGSFLLAAEQGERLKMELAAAGIPSAVIGRLTDGNDRVLRNGEEKRFLELPKRNELRDESGGKDEGEDFSCY